MSEFLNVGLFSRNSAAGRVERPEALTRPERSSERHGRVEARDQVEISEHARHLAVLQTMPATRSAKIDAAKAMIASGGYDDPEFLTISIERMIAEDLA